MSPSATPEIVRTLPLAKTPSDVSPIRQKTVAETPRTLPVTESVPVSRDLSQTPTRADAPVGIGDVIENGPETAMGTENGPETGMGTPPSSGKKKKTIIVKKTVKQKKQIAAERRKQYGSEVVVPRLCVWLSILSVRAATRDLEKEADVAIVIAASESMTPDGRPIMRKSSSGKSSSGGSDLVWCEALVLSTVCMLSKEAFQSVGFLYVWDKICCNGTAEAALSLLYPGGFWMLFNDLFMHGVPTSKFELSPQFC